MPTSSQQSPRLEGAAAETRLYLVTEEDILEADSYLFGGASGDGMSAPVPEVQVSKATDQLGSAGATVSRWATPRVNPTDLLLFFDWNVWHRRSVIVKAMLVGGLGWHLEMEGEVVYDPRKGVDLASDHPAARLVKRPNSNRMETLDELVFRHLVDFFSTGNAYWEAARNRRGDVAELYHAPGRTMRRDRGFRGYWQVKQNRSRFFGDFGQPAAGRNEILHVYEYDPSSDYYGIPGWYAALAQMGLERSILEFNVQLFKNSMMAHLAIVVEGGKLSKDAREALKKFVRERATGLENAGRIIILEDERSQTKIRVEKLNLEVKDLMITKALEHFRDAVITASGVPPRILGIMTPGQLGASGEIEGQLRVFRETVLRPARRKLELGLHAILEELEPTAYVRFAEMDITSIRDDADFWDKMIERGVYKAEEVRQLLDQQGV